MNKPKHIHKVPGRESFCNIWLNKEEMANSFPHPDFILQFVNRIVNSNLPDDGICNECFENLLDLHYSNPANCPPVIESLPIENPVTPSESELIKSSLMESYLEYQRTSPKYNQSKTTAK